MTRRALREHCFKVLFCTDYYPVEEADEQIVRYFDQPSENARMKLESGVDIGDDVLTLPAKVTAINKTSVHITIHEGRFHQIKRMLEAVDNEVIFLKRLSMGSLRLDENLKPGEYRELTPEELAALVC